MKLSYQAVAPVPEAVAVVVTDEKGLNWSPTLKKFVPEYPADCRVPLVRPATHPEAAMAFVPNLPHPNVTAWLADAAGKLVDPVSFVISATGSAYAAVIAAESV